MKRSASPLSTSSSSSLPREYHLVIRKALLGVIDQFKLGDKVDINTVVGPVCALVDTACNTMPGEPEPNLDERLRVDVEPKITELLQGDAKAASDVLGRVRPLLKLYVVDPALKGSPPNEAKKSRRERGPPKPSSSDALSASAGQRNEDSKAGLLDAPVPLPRQFQVPIGTLRPTRSVIILNMPSEFNTFDAISNLILFHTGRAPRVVHPAFPDQTSAYVKLHLAMDGHYLISLGSRLVDAFPAIVARPPSLGEIREATYRSCAPIREAESRARAALSKLNESFDIAAAQQSLGSTVATKKEIAEVRASYDAYKTELDLLTALGPVADATRRKEVLLAMKSRLDLLKTLNERLIKEQNEQPAASSVDPPLKKKYSSSVAHIEDPYALIYVGPFVEPLHDDALLALLSHLPITAKHIWREEKPPYTVCIELSSSNEASYLLNEFLYPSYGKFCDWIFARKPPLDINCVLERSKAEDEEDPAQHNHHP